VSSCFPNIWPMMPTDPKRLSNRLKAWRNPFQNVARSHKNLNGPSLFSVVSKRCAHSALRCRSGVSMCNAMQTSQRSAVQASAAAIERWLESHQIRNRRPFAQDGNRPAGVVEEVVAVVDAQVLINRRQDVLWCQRPLGWIFGA